MKTTSFYISLSLSFLFVLLYGFLLEPNRVQITKVTVQNDELAELLKNMKVALLSDLHIGTTWSFSVRKSLTILKNIKPDIIFITGDLVQWNTGDEGYEKAIEYLALLDAPYGIFAVLGDSDEVRSRKSCEFCHERGTTAKTKRHNVTFLRDKSVPVQTKNGSFFLGTGINSNNKTVTLPPPNIVLNHSSMIFNALSKEKNLLILSGDTHGGQILLPDFFWKKWKRKPDPDHMYGLYRKGSNNLYVTSGIGTSGIPFRLGMPPEIALLSFRHKNEL